MGQAPVYRCGEEEFCCLRRFVAERLLQQGVRPDSISEIALLAEQRQATRHLPAIYMVLAGQHASVVDANATGIIRLLGLSLADAAIFRYINRKQRTEHGRQRALACTCKIAETPPWAA